ncbi:hypothetical protein BY458DRAFT_561083 [Sporodiniella umbellata]|nr:hypothetical protein BY458DRAFT_561083 [Sporodiniella umbellata]
MTTLALILLIIGYTLLALLFFVERRYESRRATATLETASDDKATSIFLTIFYILTAIVPTAYLFLLDTEETAFPYTAMVGILFMLSALALMRWAVLTNPFYLCSMSTTDDQYICTTGPYKTIRHPGYCAYLISWAGFTLVVGNWLFFFIVFVPLTCTYFVRIQAEEQMMLDRFAMDYQQYTYETYRMIPYVL